MHLETLVEVLETMDDGQVSPGLWLSCKSSLSNYPSTQVAILKVYV